MFSISFRRKPKKAQDSPLVKSTLSLPDINSQGIPWPEEFVDISAIRDLPPPEAGPQHGAAKSSVRESSETPIAFHKPFRNFAGVAAKGGSISAMFMSSPPSSFANILKPTGRFSQRRTRVPPTFNLMVSAPTWKLLFPCFVAEEDLILLRSSAASKRERPPCFVCFSKRPISRQLLPWTSALRSTGSSRTRLKPRRQFRRPA